MMKCLHWASEKTESTYSPGLPWLSRTRKSPCCLSSSWASVRGIAPWYHSCSPNGFSLMAITSINLCVGKVIKLKCGPAFFFRILLIIKKNEKVLTDDEPSTDFGERMMPAIEWRRVSNFDILSLLLSWYKTHFTL